MSVFLATLATNALNSAISQSGSGGVPGGVPGGIDASNIAGSLIGNLTGSIFGGSPTGAATCDWHNNKNYGPSPFFYGRRAKMSYRDSDALLKFFDGADKGLMSHGWGQNTVPHHNNDKFLNAEKRVFEILPYYLAMVKLGYLPLIDTLSRYEGEDSRPNAITQFLSSTDINAFLNDAESQAVRMGLTRQFNGTILPINTTLTMAVQPSTQIVNDGNSIPSGQIGTQNLGITATNSKNMIYYILGGLVLLFLLRSFRPTIRRSPRHRTRRVTKRRSFRRRIRKSFRRFRKRFSRRRR